MAAVQKTYFLFQIIFVVVLASDLIAAENNSLNVTTSLEDYIIQLERQYANVIANDEATVAEFRAGYERQLGTIDAQRLFIETELEVADKKYYSLEFLNDLAKHCVQKFRQFLYAISTVRKNFQSCITTARSHLNTILASVDNSLGFLKNLLNTNFKNGITDCERKHKNSYENHTICVVNFNNQFSVSFNNQQRTFLTNLDTARCSEETRIHQTVECVFKTVNASLSSIGSTSTSIDDCITGFELCKPFSLFRHNRVTDKMFLNFVHQ